MGWDCLSFHKFQLCSRCFYEIIWNGKWDVQKFCHTSGVNIIKYRVYTCPGPPLAFIHPVEKFPIRYFVDGWLYLSSRTKPLGYVPAKCKLYYASQPISYFQLCTRPRLFSTLSWKRIGLIHGFMMDRKPFCWLQIFVTVDIKHFRSSLKADKIIMNATICANFNSL